MLGPRGPYPATHGRNPSVPNADDLKNDVLKRRSIGRNYGHYGGAEAVVFLPEGKTVAGVVRDVVENALRGPGYRIVDPGSAESSGALKLKAIIMITGAGPLPVPGFCKTSNFHCSATGRCRMNTSTGLDPRQQSKIFGF